MPGLSFQQLFSMSALEGLRAIRLQISLRPDLSLDETIRIVKSTEADACSFDFDAAVFLLDLIDDGIEPHGFGFYQHCIHCIIVSQQPIWARLMTLGRTRFVKKLDRDEASIFREAGLLVEPPSDCVIAWWDHITGLVRLEGDKVKLERARRAEKLTLKYEEEKLQEAGIATKPVWIAIEDNTAGYDVLSYTQNEFGLVNKLIEVKSTVASPLRFYLTRNEWKQALEYGESYLFHIWDMQQDPPNLFVKTVADIQPHVPKDNEKGKWSNAEIPINI